MVANIFIIRWYYNATSLLHRAIILHSAYAKHTISMYLQQTQRIYLYVCYAMESICLYWTYVV